jgi:hypothetical protein
MNNSSHFKVEYQLRGEPKSFYVRAPKMDSSAAWHISAVDAGFATIPKFKYDPCPRVTKPKAERLGITDVAWREA